ncbi:MAG: AraC family transcriptional regulator N-terminal domain-containing protein, partial [Mailhella sp.]
YKEGQFCLSGVELPSSFYILHPSEEKPFLAVILDLDSQIISRLTMKMQPFSESRYEGCSALSIGNLDADLLNCFLHLVELLDKPEQIRIRAPLIIQEIHYLLLAGPQGENLRKLNTMGTKSNRIAQTISWLKNNYKSPLQVEELAQKANMSSSTFHRYFKEITGLSPLQFHNQLRLHEAQRLMVLENQKASHVSLLVGYESDTQFNREYKRLFGVPPYRDKLQRQIFVL